MIFLNKNAVGVAGLPFAVVRISTSYSARPGAVHHGTGFIYERTIDPEHSLPVLITNKHVIGDRDRLTIDFGLADENGNRIFGPPYSVSVNIVPDSIFRHSSPAIDLAAIPLQPFILASKANSVRLHMLSLGNQLLPPKWIASQLMSGASVVMVGYPNGIIDVSNNFPVVRKGTLATPYFLDHQGESNFVVDIAAFGGSSGSPIFLHFDGIIPQENGSIAVGGSEVYLLGVLHSGPVINLQGEVTVRPVPTTTQIVANMPMMMHLGYCVRVDRVEEMLDQFIATHPPLKKTTP